MTTFVKLYVQGELSKMPVVYDRFGTNGLDKIGLSLKGEAGQAFACLYSEVRLYKGPGPANPPQSTATRSTGNISVWIQKVGHSNTRGIVSSLFFSRSEITAALSLHFQHLYED